MDRVILHCDLNGFYASVESLYYPQYAGKPMAVCGNPENRHGIVLAKNELAKACGVVTAQTVWQALKLCPDLNLVPPHHERYQEFSIKTNKIYQRFTDQVEPFGIDESWLDVTGSTHLFGSGEQIAGQIRAAIKQELGLTASVGVSFNKVFAKLGSDYKKPDATTCITRENYRQIVFAQPVSNLLYVGKVTQEKLARLGVHTIGELAVLPVQTLEALLGKQGYQLSLYANGLDEEPVQKADEQQAVKSIGNGITFRRNLLGLEDVQTGVLALSQTVAARLRKQGMKCGGVQVAIKNTALKTIDRQQQFPVPTHLTKDICAGAVELVRRNWDLRQPIRMLTITAINLTPESNAEQLDFFAPIRDTSKLEALDSSLDKIKEKFGKAALRPASLLKNDLGIDD